VQAQEVVGVKVKNNNIQRSRITWLSFQYLDSFLSKTAYMQISKSLAELGNDIDFFALRSKKHFKSENPNMRLFAVPLRSVPIITGLSYVILLLLLLPLYIAKRRPDFIITEPRFGSTFFSLELKFFTNSIRPALILDIRSTPVTIISFRALLNSLWFNSSVALAKRTFDGLTAATKEMKYEICNKFNLNPEMIYVWKNGVDLELFSPEKYDDTLMRKRLGVNGKFVVFYHGAFRINGGVVETIKSIKLLESKYPDIVLFLLGSGPGLSLFKKTINENEVGDSVIIHSPVDYTDVPRYIAIGNVGIVPLPDIPDWRYQSPLKLVEYLAMKKPVIVTDIPANREFIKDDKCGIYLSSVNPEEIARAISFVYKNKEELQEFAKSERTIPIKEYDWKTVATKFEEYLQEFAGRN
jgi:glycosyltransferase involved in cell wall biosynthesis